MVADILKREYIIYLSKKYIMRMYDQSSLMKILVKIDFFKGVTFKDIALWKQHSLQEDPD